MPNHIKKANKNITKQSVYKTKKGILYNANCLEILPKLKSSSIDTIFADPPFNLKKSYGKKTSDNLTDEEYLEWTEKWLKECVRLIKPGGSFFIYNLPKWNIPIGNLLSGFGLTFKHWVAINITFSLPINNRLYPSHYSLLYYTKGKPKTFNKVRTPIKTCRHCNGDIKDYGGHKKHMNPNGVNLTDVWDDIPPVRHKKYKNNLRSANQLSTKLLNRVIQISTVPGEKVLDPFGGSGTTYAVCEALNRKWVGIEINDCTPIIKRLTTKNVEEHATSDYIEPSKLKLIKK